MQPPTVTRDKLTSESGEPKAPAGAHNTDSEVIEEANTPTTLTGKLSGLAKWNGSDGQRSY